MLRRIRNLSRKRSRNTKRRRIINGTLSWTIREDLAPHGWPQLLSAVSRKNTWVIGTTGRDRGVGTSHRLRSAFFLGQSDVQLTANRHGPHSCQFSMCWTTAVRSLFICLLNQVYLTAYTVGLQLFLSRSNSFPEVAVTLVDWLSRLFGCGSDSLGPSTVLSTGELVCTLPLFCVGCRKTNWRDSVSPGVLAKAGYVCLVFIPFRSYFPL